MQPDRPTEAQLAHLRELMVEKQLRARDITDASVLSAMLRVPRHSFVEEQYLNEAYEDHPIPIGYGQTISQPYVVALMTQHLQLQPNDEVLEIGTGCGYQTAIIASIAKSVFSIEVIGQLQQKAKLLLENLGFTNVEYATGDGRKGCLEAKTFSKIICAAAAEQIPQALLNQLRDQGRMILPVGTSEQVLTLVTKNGTEISEQALIRVRFVPLV